MKERFIAYLHNKAQADKDKALGSLNLLLDNAVGIGDHSTDDFYSNLDEALNGLVDAEARLEVLNIYFPKEKQIHGCCLCWANSLDIRDYGSLTRLVFTAQRRTEGLQQKKMDYQNKKRYKKQKARDKKRRARAKRRSVAVKFDNREQKQIEKLKWVNREKLKPIRKEEDEQYQRRTRRSL